MDDVYQTADQIDSSSTVIHIPSEFYSREPNETDSLTESEIPDKEQLNKWIWEFFNKSVTFLITLVTCIVLASLFFYVEGNYIPSQTTNVTVVNTTAIPVTVDTESHIKVDIDYPPTEEVAIVMTISVLTSLAVVKFKCVRVIALLTLQGITTSRGRAIMLTVIIRLLLTGPITNTLNNARKIKETISCQVDMFSDELKDMQSALLLKVREFTNGTLSQMLPLQIETLKKILDHELPIQIIKSVFSSFPFKVTIDTSDLYNSASITVRNVTFYSHDVANYTNNVDPSFYFEQTNVTGVEGILAIGGKLIAAFNDMTSVNRLIVVILNFLLSVPIAVLVLIQACLYLRGFLHDLEYDNIYITSAFKKLDKETDSLLPLRKKERIHFIDSTALCLSKQELVSIFRGLLMILALLAAAVLLCGVDVLLYLVLEVVRKEANVTVLINGGSGVEVALNDSSPSISQLLHQELPFLFTGNSTHFKYSLELNTSPCLPDPLPPFYEDKTELAYLTGMFIGISILTLLQSYGVRLQHKITEIYYPERFKKRVDHLYQHLRFERMKPIDKGNGFIRWLMSTLRQIPTLVTSITKDKCVDCSSMKNLKQINGKWRCRMCIHKGYDYEQGFVYRVYPKNDSSKTSHWLASRFSRVVSLMRSNTKSACVSCGTMKNVIHTDGRWRCRMCIHKGYGEGYVYRVYP